MSLDIRVTDPGDSKNYDFTLFPKESGGKEIQVISRPWENDHRIPWQVDLHGWDEGLGPDRFRGRKTYAKANADFSHSGIAVPPPKVNLIEPSNVIPRISTLGALDRKTATGTGSTLAVDTPDLVQDDDLMLAWVFSTSQVSHAQASWTQIGSDLDFGSARASLWRKKASSEPGNYTWTFGSSTTAIIDVIAYVGVDTTTAIDDSDSAASATETSVTIPESTSTVAKAKRLVFLATETAVTIIPPNTLTTHPRADHTNDPSAVTSKTFLMEEGFGDAGATPAGSITLSATSPNAIFQVMLKPAASFTVGNTSDKVADYINRKYFTQGDLVSMIYNTYNPLLYVVADLSGTVTDVEVFDNEVVAAMGAATKLFVKATPGTPTEGAFTQASDNTFAKHLAVVKNQLWRDEDGQLISNAIVDPETLTSYAPASPNQYDVGESAIFAITRMVDYGGVLWAGKVNGMFSPDQLAQYGNQTPQLVTAVDPVNCVGSFTAQGFLWVPSPYGMLRVQLGEALAFGPSLSSRPDYRFRVLHGVEWDQWIYLLVTDTSNVSAPFICKANMRDSENLVFHEWVRLSDLKSTATTGWITVTGTGHGPVMLVTIDGKTGWIRLGRGGGRNIDDTLYEYGAAWEFETGKFTPRDDLTLTHMLVGVKTAIDADANESCTFTYLVDGESLSDIALKELDNLVGHWPMGEASGDVLDASVNSNNGVVTLGAGVRDAAALNTNGDGSIEFDKADTMITVSDNSAIQDIFDGGGSVFFMFNADSDGENDSGRIFSKGTTAWRVEVGGQTGSNIFMLLKQEWSGDDPRWDTAVDIPLNTTIIGVWTYDSDSIGNDPILYLWDGTSLTTRTVANGLLTEQTTPTGTRVSDVGDDLIIGNRADQLLTFDGHIDEPMLFSDILTAAEAKKLIHHALAELLDTQEGGGNAPITNTGGYVSATRYAPVGTTGQFFDIKMSGTLSATQLGTDRPEIRELVAFGYTHSKVTDLITLQIYTDRGHFFSSSRGRGEVRRQWSEWHNDGDILLIVIPGYEEGRSIRVKVVGVTELNLETRMGPGNTQDRADVVEVTVERIDYANSYADAG